MLNSHNKRDMCSISNALIMTVLLLPFTIVSGQKTIKSQTALKVIEHKIDSLKALKTLITKKMTEIDNQINQLTKLKNEIEFKEATPTDDLIGVIKNDIHMKLTNGDMSEKIKAKSQVLILDYSPETKKFKINFQGQIGYLSDSWVEQTNRISKYKRTKATRTIKVTNENGQFVVSVGLSEYSKYHHGGFVDKNVSFSQDNVGEHIWTKGIGEILNNSGNSYKSTYFDFNIYDADNKLIGVRPIAINNFRKGQTRSFSCDFKGIYARDIKFYRIDFSIGY